MSYVQNCKALGIPLSGDMTHYHAAVAQLLHRHVMLIAAVEDGHVSAGKPAQPLQNPQPMQIEFCAATIDKLAAEISGRVVSQLSTPGRN